MTLAEFITYFEQAFPSATVADFITRIDETYKIIYRKKKLINLFHQIDVNKDGTLSKTEFSSLCLTWNPMVAADAVEAAWAKMASSAFATSVNVKEFIEYVYTITADQDDASFLAKAEPTIGGLGIRSILLPQSPLAGPWGGSADSNLLAVGISWAPARFFFLFLFLFWPAMGLVLCRFLQLFVSPLLGS